MTPVDPILSEYMAALARKGAQTISDAQRTARRASAAKMRETRWQKCPTLKKPLTTATLPSKNEG